jgi:DNA-binding beta-propeller fold protein YncE
MPFSRVPLLVLLGCLSISPVALARGPERIPPADSPAAQMLLASDVTNGNLLRLNPQTGASTVIGPFGLGLVSGMAYDTQRGILFGVTTSTNNLVTINPATGAATIVGPLGATLMHGFEYNPDDDTLYGIGGTANNRTMYRIDRVTGLATQIGTVLGPSSYTIVYDSTLSVMYAAAIPTQTLHRINMATGALTLIGQFGAPGMPIPQVGLGMAFDPALGLFATDNTASSANSNPFYRINTATGQATLVGIVPGPVNLLGLAFVPEAGCYPDCDGDGLLTLADFGCFQTKFGLGDLYADCDGDALLTLADFGCFQTKFGLGCP